MINIIVFFILNCSYIKKYFGKEIETEKCSPGLNSYYNKKHYINRSFIDLDNRIDQKKWFLYAKNPKNSPCDPLNPIK